MQDFVDALVKAGFGYRAVLHSGKDSIVGFRQGVWHQKYITPRLDGLDGSLAGSVGFCDGVHRK